MNETVKINSLFNKTITGKIMQKIRGGLQLVATIRGRV